MAKFAVRFYIKEVGKDEPREYGKLQRFDYKVLTDKEKKGKPPNCFRFENRTFLYNPKAVHSYTKSGEPILKYEINNSIANDGVVNNPIEPMDEKELNQTPEQQKIDSALFDVTYARGEEKAVIAGSQKTKDEFNWKTFIIGAVCGGFGGAMIILILCLNHVIHIA